MSKVDDARDALCDEIISRVQDAPNIDGLQQLAESFSKIAHGPQGGMMNYNYTGDILNRHDHKREHGTGFSPS